MHMSIKKLLVIFAISSLIAGCTGLSGSQSPAPVYGGQPETYQKSPPQSVQQKQIEEQSQSSSQITIQPLKDVTVPETIPLETTTAALPEFSEPSPNASMPEEVTPIEVSPSEKPEELPTITDSTPFKPLDSVASGSAAVSALVLASNQDSQAGKMDSAVATMERAIRLEPRNPTLLYKLAVLRLQQAKPAQAEDLAKKAALLASKDARLKKHSWLLIARAREVQQDHAGAKEARQKADSF